MAIDDNTSYELTGYQVKDLAGRIRRKADASSVPTSISDLGQVTASDVDWASLEDLSGSGFLQVVKKVNTITINNGDNNFSVDISSDIPSGFLPIGIVGRNMSGEGYTCIRVTREYISDDGTKIWVSNYADYGSSTSITTTFYILCVRIS